MPLEGDYRDYKSMPHATEISPRPAIIEPYGRVLIRSCAISLLFLVNIHLILRCERTVNGREDVQISFDFDVDFGRF